MKKYLILLYCTVILTFSMTAQDCNPVALQKKPGTWKAGMKGSVYGVNATDLTKEKAVIAAIHKMVSTNHSPVGCEISYSSAYSTESHYLADPYHYTMHILRYLCDKNSPDKSKSYVDVSTPTTVTVSANVIHSNTTLYASDLRDDFRGYLQLIQRPKKIDGYYYLGEEVVGDSHLPNKIKEYRWLITYDDQLPFKYLSRKEYLLIQQKRINKSIKDSPGDAKYNQKYLNNIEEHLKKPASELNEPAVCMRNEEERFEKFVDEGTPGSFTAIVPNLDYYRKNAPRSSPQFFTVVFKISHGDPVFEENITGIKKAIDFATLKNMLGK